MFLHTVETLEIFKDNPEGLYKLQKGMAGLQRTLKRMYEIKSYNEKQFVAAVHMHFPDICVFKLEQYWRGEYITEKLNEIADAVYKLL
jgi:hypothetical protein